jgi:predicted site-specific integrase-resolvase
MSARNGDKSRFHRERKQKIARRKRAAALLERISRAHKPEDTSARVKPRSVPA